MLGLLERMGVQTEVEGRATDGNLLIEVKSDEGVLIGRHGRTLESLQLIVNRMVNKELGKPVRVELDVGGYKKRRADSLRKMAEEFGEDAKKTGRHITIGPYSAHDRRTIHIALKDNPSIKTESIGEGEWKKIKIFPIDQDNVSDV